MSFPDFKSFVFPYGGFTQTKYAGPAVTAYGNMIGALAGADAQQRAAEAQARFGGMADAFGSYSSGMANALNSYSGLLGNTAGASANAFGGLTGGLSSLGQSRSNEVAARNNALSGMTTGLGGVLANLYGTQGGNMAALGNSQSSEATGLANAFAGMEGSIANAIANTYGGHAGAMGNIATAMSNEAANRYSSNAMAEAARMGALGNIGSSALGAFGSAAGQAMGAFGQAESAYQNSRGNVAAANQNAVGNIGSANQAATGNIGNARVNAYGQLGTGNQQAIANIAASRNSALSNLGSATANAGTGLGAAALAGDLDLSFTDYGYSPPDGVGGFSASGPEGPIASGSFGGGGGMGSGGMSLTASRRQGGNDLSGVTDRTFGGLSSLASQVDNQPGYGELARSLASSQAAIAGDPAYGELAGNMSSAFDALAPGLESISTGPDYSFLSNTLGSTLSGLTGLARDAYGNANMGMNQFYNNQLMPTDYSPLMDRLDSQYQTALSAAGGRGGNSGIFSRSDYSGFADAINSGFGASSKMVGDLANRGFSAIENNPYRDGDLLAGLYAGYGDTMGAVDRAAERGAGAFAGTSDFLRGGFDSTIGALGRQAAPSVAGNILQAMNSAESNRASRRLNPLKELARREYEALVSAGPSSRFYSGSPDYDKQAASELGRLSRIIRSGSLPSWTT